MSNKSAALLGFTLYLFALAPAHAQPSGARGATDAASAVAPTQPATGFLPENLGKPAHRIGGATRGIAGDVLGIPGAPQLGADTAAPKPSEQPPTEVERPAQNNLGK